MNRKERVLKALQHQPPDITPWSFDFTARMREKMAVHLKDNNFEEKLGNHIFDLRPNFKWDEIKPSVFKDEFGVIWDRTVDEDIGCAVNTVLDDPSKLDKLKFPDLKAPGRFSHYEENIKKHADQFIYSRCSNAIFERGWLLRGMENLLCDMAGDEGFVNEFFDRITAYNLELIELTSKQNVDAMRFGDDYGQQSGLIMGPTYWRKYLKPRLAKLYKKTKDCGMKVLIHTCGDVEQILPDLIEIGVDVFNPFQPEVFDIYKIKKLYGNKLTFYGGMSIQKVLPFGSTEDVRKETEKLIREIGKDGGYILAPAHETPKDVPAENILAMLDVLQHQK